MFDKGTSANKNANEIGMTLQNVNRMFACRIVNSRYVKLIEHLGYDIEVNYVER